MGKTWSSAAVALFMSFGFVASARAEDPVEGELAEPAPSLAPTITGHLDGTYNYNLMQPAGGVTPFHSYTAKHNTFLLNLAHVAIGGHDDQVTYVVEIDAGTDAAINSAAYGGGVIDIQEAWVAYVHPDSHVGFKAGKFVTFNGIEVVENTANPTISRGLLFGLAEPATHVGGLLTYQINDTLDVAVGAVNGWDTLVDNNSLKTFIAKLGITTDGALATVSAFAGPEQPGNNDDWRTTLDATAVIKLAQLDLWLQANVGMEQVGDDSVMWMGGGVQPVFTINDDLKLGARAEVFVDGDGARTGLDQTLFTVAAAPAYLVAPNLKLRAEARLDVSSEEAFINEDGDAGTLQVIALTEVLYAFGM